ncbi:hypothetical protein HC248_00869 [Polaromonas vacuolata]|uniref:Calcineurin-like phosphoesterase domain-containing protein n=1 Tax=Polaromonas vacuolata TaxID=37448 RepID=A0A6H2H6V2_9BURK|nr:hypothetical protein [Polaromonas vacuolata]QJC55588.1 hypothetical protein HC248_00869 [Polaromonas vacuolata]
MNASNENPGRSCPLAYRYGAAALATAPIVSAQTLYVVGGLYGNAQALDAVDILAAQEKSKPTICFNGDFNWFNVDEPGFASINQRVLAHHAIAGNVEFELSTAMTDAGCGCAYPDNVDDSLVERSNRIHTRLKLTAQMFPEILRRLSSLPMFARYSVGDAQIAVVHGDANSLSGWSFDAAELDKSANRASIVQAFAAAKVDIFASTHTCLPSTRRFDLAHGMGIVANNGAAGMPNFQGQHAGLLTRISIHPCPHARVYGVKQAEVYIDTISIDYDTSSWSEAFLRNWPQGSDAHVSYWARIQDGPSYQVSQAFKPD